MRSHASYVRRNQRLKGRVAEPKEKIAREVILPETITIQELANRMSERAVDVIRLLMKSGEMHKITDVIDADTAELVAEEIGHTVKRVAESDVEEGLFARRHRRGSRRRARPWSPSWATSITARPRCSTPFATPRSSPAKRAASPSTSAPIRSSAQGAQGHLPRHPRPRSLHGDARPRRQGHGHRRAGRRRRRRRHAADHRGDQPRQGGATCRSSSRSTRSTSPTPSRSACAPSCCSTKSRSKAWAATRSTSKSRPSQKLNLDKLLETIVLQAEVLDLKANADRAGRGHGHRGAARQGPRAGRHRAGAARHAARRRHRRRRLAMGPRARAARRQGRRASRRRPLVPGRDSGLLRHAGSRRPRGRRRKRSPRARRSPNIASARSARRSPRAAARRAVRSPT